jgi:hypothetical protein
MWVGRIERWTVRNMNEPKFNFFYLKHVLQIIVCRRDRVKLIKNIKILYQKEIFNELNNIDINITICVKVD